MELIGENEYVRTDRGNIGKYKDFFNNYFEVIIKNSQNIIDLIEEGDYVNGYKVLDVVEDMKTRELHLEMPMDYTNPELGDCTIYNKDIKDVVTKEQFNQLKYIVDE